MLDRKEQAGERLLYFQEKGERVFQKYDLWKAMDFEKQIRIITKSDSDLGMEILKYLFGLMHQENQDVNIMNIQFKILSKSSIFEQKFNRVTKFQHYVWTQILSPEDK